jgi:dTDP-4-dehydrorhamnose reductase
MKKYLITGSSGLIGSQIVKDLLSKGHQVYSCYNKLKPADGKSIHMDLTDSKDIENSLHEIKPDVIIHLAAMTNVDECETNEKIATTVNVDATKLLLIHATKFNSFFIYVSTDYVFDGIMGMYNESDTPKPLGIYGKTKLDGEKEVQKSQCNWCIARTSTPFGFHPTKKTFPIWVINNLKNNKKINIFTDQFTSPTYVPNLSKMLIEISEKKISGIIHVSGASRISRFNFSQKIIEKLNLDSTLINPISLDQTESKNHRPKDSSLDVSLAQKILDEKPMGIEKSLELFIKDLEKTAILY